MIANIVAIVRGIAYIVNDLAHEPDDHLNVSLVEYLLSATQLAALVFELRAVVPFLRASRPWPSEEQWLQSIAVAAASLANSAKPEQHVPLAVAVASSIASHQARQAALASRREAATFWCRVCFHGRSSPTQARAIPLHV